MAEEIQRSILGASKCVSGFLNTSIGPMCAGIPKGFEHAHEKKGRDLDMGIRTHLKCNFDNQNLISKNHPPIFQIARGQGKAKTAGSQRALKMVGESQNSSLGALKCVFGSV